MRVASGHRMDGALSTGGYRRLCRLVSLCCALVLLSGWLQPAARAIWGGTASVLPAAASSGNLAASDTSPEVRDAAMLAPSAMLKAGGQLRAEPRKLPDPEIPPALEPMDASPSQPLRTAGAAYRAAPPAGPAPRHSRLKPTGPPSLPS